MGEDAGLGIYQKEHVPAKGCPSKETHQKQIAQYGISQWKERCPAKDCHHKDDDQKGGCPTKGGFHRNHAMNGGGPKGRHNRKAHAQEWGKPQHGGTHRRGDSPQTSGWPQQRGLTRRVMPLRVALSRSTTHKHCVMHRTTEKSCTTNLGGI